MCCFSRPVPHVSATKIFARALDGSRQALVYQMQVTIPEDLAMVLPLPVPARSPEDAVEFVDLSGYPTFFDDLAAAFPPLLMAAQSFGFGPPGVAPAPAPLKVHDVGDFEASFVPSLADFSRLDPRFRLPDGVWDRVPRVADYGFAVFKLKPKAARASQTIHPMALTFPRRDPRSLYFPTLHVHDGTLASSAHFDHTLYCQPSEILAHLFAWRPSNEPLGRRVDAERARGLVDGAAYGFQLGALGDLENDDVWLMEPEGVSVADLRPTGRCFLGHVRVGRGFGAPPAALDVPLVRRERVWRETSRTKVGALCRGVRAGLAALEQTRADELGLGDFSWSLPPYFMNGPQLWHGTSYLDGRPAGEGGGGPGRLTLEPFTDKVEPQSVTLGFRSMPDKPKLAMIEAELRRILDASIA
jgi:hypothetical protein